MINRRGRDGRITRPVIQRTLELLKKKAEELHLDLSSSVVLSDFELAIIQAAELSQIQNLGLQVAYREDHHLNSFIRKSRRNDTNSSIVGEMRVGKM